MTISNIGYSNAPLFFRYNQVPFEEGLPNGELEFLENEQSFSLPAYSSTEEFERFNRNQDLAQELGVRVALYQDNDSVNVQEMFFENELVFDDDKLSKDDLKALAKDFPELSKLYNAIQKDFGKADTDEDGKISINEELEFAKANNIKHPFNDDDTTVFSDKLSKEELKSMANENPELKELFDAILKNFGKADTDKDGKISIDEEFAFAKANKIQHPFDDYDTTVFSDKLSKEELKSMANESPELKEVFNAILKNFGKADTDKDGKISVDEELAFAKANKIKHPYASDIADTKTILLKA